MRGGDGQNYPDYEDEDKQEAARFLCTDIDARPVIRGIDDPERMEAWTAVAEDLDIESRQRRALRQREQALAGSGEEVAFERATEINEPSIDAEPASADAEPETAVADGGAVVEETDDVGNRELGPDQEWAEYEDEAAFESEKRSIRGFVFSETYGTVDAVEEALDEEYARDVVQRHAVELLEERLEDLRA